MPFFFSADCLIFTPINRILHYTMALKSPRTAMILAIVIIAVTFLVVVGVMLAYWPKGISINENDEIQLSTYIVEPSDQDQRHEPWQNQLWPLQEHKNRAEDVPLSHR